jgi:hypothetical protein
MLILIAAQFVVSAAAFLLIGWVDRRSIERFDSLHTARQATYDDTAVRSALDVHDDRLSGLQDSIQELADAVRNQNIAIAEGIERTDRAERRVRAAVGRAKARMDAAGFHDEALAAEAESLQLEHGAGREQQRLQDMQPDMGGDQSRDMSAFPGSW